MKLFSKKENQNMRMETYNGSAQADFISEGWQHAHFHYS